MRGVYSDLWQKLHCFTFILFFVQKQEESKMDIDVIEAHRNFNNKI